MAKDTIMDARKKAWDWLKSAFVKPGPAAALAEFAENPEDNERHELLQVHLRHALEKDEAFRKQLFALFPEEHRGIESTQTIGDVSGDGATVVQAAGSTVKITR